MTIRKLIAAGLVLTLLAGAVAYATGGTSADPVVTISYIQEKLLPQFNQNLEAAASSAEPELRSLYDEALLALDAADTREVTSDPASVEAQIEYEAYMRALDGGFWRETTTSVEVTLAPGERLIVAEGGEMRLISGIAVLAGERASAIVNTATATQYYSSMPMSAGTRYIVASGGTLSGAESAGGAVLLVTGRYQVVPPTAARHTDAALALGTLGVLRGTNRGYELERGATRLEALIMFLRLIGEESAALAYEGGCPFDDLPEWGGADTPARYVGYAYSKGYTNGISETKFGTNDIATFEMYVTFLLRALGYSDAEGDFDWASAPTAAVNLGVITPCERESAARRAFSRDTLAYISWRALEAPCKDGALLSEKLIAAGVFTAESYDAAKALGVRSLAAAAEPVTEPTDEGSAEPPFEPATETSGEPSNEPAAE